MAVNDDELSSELKGVLAERGQPENGAGLVEAALIEAVAPVVPPAGALAGLLQKVRAEDRIVWLAPRLAELYDLSLEAALALIAKLPDSSAWMDGPAPGVKLMPVNAGPKAGEALAALVRLEPGMVFPEHPHLGPEKVLVLEGGYLDSGGAEYWRGELHASDTGTSHSFRAIGGIACICAGLNATSS